MVKKRLNIRSTNSDDILNFTKESQLLVEEVNVSYKDLGNNQILMYLASIEFEAIDIEVRDGFWNKTIETILDYCENITYKLTGTQNKGTLDFMMYLYPDKEGLLRHAYITKKDLKEVV